MWYLLLEYLRWWAVLTIAATIVGFIIGLFLRLQRSQLACRYRLWRLCDVQKELDFIYDIVGNEGVHKVPFGQFYCDADYSVIVSKDGSVVGLIGFKIKSDRIVVVQLQGLKGVNLKGLELAPYLLKCTEQIACILNKSFVQICPAQRNDYYSLYNNRELQDRLVKIYNTVPASMGYELVGEGFSKGWLTKKLA